MLSRRAFGVGGVFLILACIWLGFFSAKSTSDRSILFFSFLNHLNRQGQGLQIFESRNYLDWVDINPYQRIGPEITYQRMLRDPFVLKSAHQAGYHLIWTNQINSDSIGYSFSQDLVTWTPTRDLRLMLKTPEIPMNCWAPEMVYRSETDDYLIHWSSTLPRISEADPNRGGEGFSHRIFYSTTRDFVYFTPAKILFDPGYSVIDSHLVKLKDGYRLYFKAERHPTLPSHVQYAFSKSAEGPFVVSGRVQGLSDGIEGVGLFRLSGQWGMMFDAHGIAFPGFATSRDLERWTDHSRDRRLPRIISHGSILEVSSEVADGIRAVGLK